jgi:5-dehydro-4-deoxyglucarate dehydratase
MARTKGPLRARLRGVIGFPVTPMAPDGSIDGEGLVRNLRAMLAQPLGGIVAPGGTGEFYSLTPEEHRLVVRAAVAAARGRVPVIAAAGVSVRLGAELARQAEAEGADGILAFPPYYPNADEEALLEYYAALGAATRLGMIFYSRDSVHPGPAWAERLARRVPRLVAWKEGQADVRRLQLLMDRLGERLVWIGGAGDDMVPAYFAAGVRIYTSSVANVSPKLALGLWSAAAAGRRAPLSRLMKRYIAPLFALRARRRGYEVSVMKRMMEQMGLAGGPVRPPLADARPEEVRPLVRAWKGLR